jgi:hypothetical protein
LVASVASSARHHGSEVSGESYSCVKYTRNVRPLATRRPFLAGWRVDRPWSVVGAPLVGALTSAMPTRRAGTRPAPTGACRPAL